MEEERSFRYLHRRKPGSHYCGRSVRTWLDKMKARVPRSTRAENSNFRASWIDQLKAFTLFQPKTNQSWNRLQGFPELLPPSVMREREELWSRECLNFSSFDLRSWRMRVGGSFPLSGHPLLSGQQHKSHFFSPTFIVKKYLYSTDTSIKRTRTP